MNVIHSVLFITFAIVCLDIVFYFNRKSLAIYNITLEVFVLNGLYLLILLNASWG